MLDVHAIRATSDEPWIYKAIWQRRFCQLSFDEMSLIASADELVPTSGTS